MSYFYLEYTVDEKTTRRELSPGEFKQFITDHVQHADAMFLPADEDHRIMLVLEWNGTPGEEDDGKPRKAVFTFAFVDKALKEVCDFLSAPELVTVPIAIPYCWLKDFTLDSE